MDLSFPNCCPHSCAAWLSFFMSHVASATCLPPMPPCALTYFTAACAPCVTAGKDVVPVLMFARPSFKLSVGAAALDDPPPLLELLDDPLLLSEEPLLQPATATT